MNLNFRQKLPKIWPILLLVCIQFFFIKPLLHAVPASVPIQEAKHSYSLVPFSEFFIDQQKRSFSEIQSMPDSAWQRIKHKHKQFPAGAEILWLRINLDNHSRRERWYLVSDYSHLDLITFFSKNLREGSDSEWRSLSNGSIVPVSRRPVLHRLPILPLELNLGKNQIFIRIESKITKRIGFTLLNPKYLYELDSIWFNPYPEFFRLVTFLAFIAFLSALYLRNSLFLYYTAYLLSIIIYFGINEGYALYYIYPENPAWNDHFHYSFGYLFGFFLILFWKRLFSMAVQLPWYNRLMTVLAWIVLVEVIYALTPVANFLALDQMARLNVIAVILLAFSANMKIVFMGQTYAIYSLFGTFFLFITFFIQVFAGIFFEAGNEMTRSPLYIGFVLESFALVLTLLSRMRFHQELRNPKDLTPPAKNQSVSRIKNFDLRLLVSELERLMKKEKLFSEDKISLASLASRLSISRHQLSELIREVYESNFYGFINNWRIQEAKELLAKEGERSVLSIAMEVGYNSKSTFNQAFKSHTGLNPTEFRNKYQRNKD